MPGPRYRTTTGHLRERDKSTPFGRQITLASECNHAEQGDTIECPAELLEWAAQFWGDKVKFVVVEE